MNTLVLNRFKPLSYACTEAMNALCTNLTFAGGKRKVIMFTSCQAGEGKSFITMNAMRTFAELGHRVVLVDADLRRSQIASRYGMRITAGNGMGLTHYLAEMCDAASALYQTNIPNAWMVPLGRPVTNSLSLLTTPRLSALLQGLRKQFDYVLVDAPPVGVIIDAAEIAKHCDGTVIAVRYNNTSRRELSRVKAQIERTDCPILGVTLNGVSFDSISSKRYYYKNYYAREDSGGERRPGSSAQRKKQTARSSRK